MQAFKAFFRVIRANLPVMSIYIVVFLALAVVFTKVGGGQGTTGYVQTKSHVAVFNEDAGAPLADGLVRCLKQNADIVMLKDDTAVIQDALFYQDVDYVLRIPKGFSEKLLAGDETVRVDKTDVPGVTASVYTDLLVNQYLNTARLVAAGAPGQPPENTAALVEEAVSHSAKVEFKTVAKTSTAGHKEGIYYYYNYLAYVMMALLILAVTSIMMVFRQKDIRRRMACSPVRSSSRSLQLVLGSVLFSLAVWVLMVAVGFVLYGSPGTPLGMALLLLNALDFCFVALCIAFLLGNFVANRAAQSAIANLLSLGLCFISGVFVPQELLGGWVKSIASFTPTYWFVAVNNTLGSASELTGETLRTILGGMGVEACFSVAIIAVSLVLLRQKAAAE